MCFIELLASLFQSAIYNKEETSLNDRIAISFTTESKLQTTKEYAYTRGQNCWYPW